MNQEQILLPRQLVGKNAQHAMLSAGLIFHEPDSPDDVFQLVTLPHGWKHRNAWGTLLDHHGHTRAWVHSNSSTPYMQITSRFTVGTLSVTHGPQVHLISGIVKDELAASSDGVRTIADGYIFQTKPQAMAERSILRYLPLERIVEMNILVGTRDELSRWEGHKIAEARAWLVAHYPDWEDTSQYWH